MASTSASNVTHSTHSTSSSKDIPIGLSAILSLCQRLYPSQPNPLQTSPAVKFWLGGQDPLDYISMFLNAGNESTGTPEHWHYITFGLSDLYGDGRIHPNDEQEEDDGEDNNPEPTTSGFGFELTFRLKRSPGELTPPLWPSEFLQDLARYIFSTKNTFVPGDHVSWHRSLDAKNDSKIQHIIMTEDAQMQTLPTPLGRVQFVQVVGVFKEELEAAQHWNGRGVLELLRSCKNAYGPFWVTDMKRKNSIFELNPQLTQSVQTGINKDGSDLSGVSCQCRWTEVKRNSRNNPGISRSLSVSDTNQIRTALANGLGDGQNAMIRYLESVHLSFNQEAGSLLGLALCGRLMHGRHFTFRSVLSDHAITFVAEGVLGTCVSRERPLAATGSWLQVFLKEEDIVEISEDVRVLTLPDRILPYRLFSWPDLKINITVSKDETLFVV